MIMIALSLFLSTIVVHIYFRSDRFPKVPFNLKIILLQKVAKCYGIVPKENVLCGTEPVFKTVGKSDDKVKFVENFFELYCEKMIRNSFYNFSENNSDQNVYDEAYNNNNNNNNNNRSILMKISKINRLKYYGIVPKFNKSDLDVQNNSKNNEISFSEKHSKIRPQNSNTNNLENKQSFYEHYYYNKQISLLNEIKILNRLEEAIKGITNELKEIKERFLIREEKNKLSSDWKQIALVLDRTFFFIFLLITVITLVFMMINTVFKL